MPELKESSERFLNRLIIGWLVYLNWDDGYQEPKKYFPDSQNTIFVWLDEIMLL
jgi:hypothetical protein